MRSHRKEKKPHHLAKDIAIVGLSIIFAFVIAKSGVIEYLLAVTKNFQELGSFIAGIFFTSLLTLAPATVILGEIAQTSPLLPVAFYGALGAVVGDLIIFFFIRDGVSQGLTAFVKASRFKRLFALLKHKHLKWLSPIIGGLIIASPLPDELGIALMGFSKVKVSVLIPVSFVMNFLGIVAVGLVAQSLI